MSLSSHAKELSRQDEEVSNAPGKSMSWALLDAWNSDGSKAFPPNIPTQSDLRFDERDRNQPDEVRIKVGYDPHAVLLFNLKIYVIDRIVQTEVGGRQKVRAWIELPMSSEFEGEWFKYMEGLPLTIQDVSPSATFAPSVHLRITEVLFTPQMTFNGVDTDTVSQVESLLARVSAVESIPRSVRRHWIQLVQHAWTYIVIPLIVTLLPRGVTGLFRRRSRSADDAS